MGQRNSLASTALSGIKGEVDYIISGVLKEFEQVTALIGNDNRYIRTRLLLAFSLVEVICVVFDKFHDLNFKPTLLMKKWFKEYCLINENEVYKNHTYIKRINEDYLYDLRCSIVHAFALPEVKGKLAVMISNGVETAPNIKKLDHGFTKKGYITVFISTDSLDSLFSCGIRILADEIFNAKEAFTAEQVKAMKRIHKELYRRGARPVPI